MELNITLYKFDYTPKQLDEIMVLAMQKGFSFANNFEETFVRLSLTSSKLTKISQMVRAIKAIQKKVV